MTDEVAVNDRCVEWCVSCYDECVCDEHSPCREAVVPAADLRPHVAALQARHHAVRRAWSAGTLSPTTYIKSCACGNDHCQERALVDAIAELLPPETETSHVAS